jgi:hypothetical protein
LSDGGGLALVCKPNGGKYWHLNFRFNGKQKTLSIGTYPTVSLAEARQAAENARRLLAQGQDQPLPSNRPSRKGKRPC